MEKELICICCPMGCHLKVNLDEKKVTGNTCPRGAAYGINELTNPVRVVTSTVKINGAIHRVLPVKTKEPIKKELIFKCMEALRDVEVNSPVKVGDVIIENILGTGVDIVAARNM
ncbi:CxxC motif-containing protein [Clostridium cavendishii DSM 21758]|uniref:CxxC motif-containing protein n=1 Tax=Clostridium cavendishii DSM 21758 TaxID=1121302 RepID=A0A1M6PPD1_9CLOT|nr:DUF1667 domain-containing protein [Clostridium cavendishii]SHK09864.1 CxxC motif-containing protein [Clostridium cavendishii DSM 21758]